MLGISRAALITLLLTTCASLVSCQEATNATAHAGPDGIVHNFVCTSLRACGPDSAAFEKPVPSLLFPSGSHPGYACQCENGTQFTISSGTGEVVPFGKAPTVTTVEEGTTKPATNKTETAVFEAADYALSLRQYGDACESVNVRLLGRPLVFPDACKRKLRLGKVCGVGCKNTLKAVGFNCYRAAFATGIADPATINSTAEAVYVQCLQGKNYTAAIIEEQEKAFAEEAAAESAAFEEEAALARGEDVAAAAEGKTPDAAAPAARLEAVLLVAGTVAAALLLS